MSASCISINGVFTCWVRDTPAALKLGTFAPSLGAPVARLAQNDQWFRCVGPTTPPVASVTKLATSEPEAMAPFELGANQPAPAISPSRRKSYEAKA